MNKDLRNLLLIALATAVIGGGLMLAGEHASGWDGMGYVLLGLAAAALGVLVLFGYQVWMAFRDGWRTPAGYTISGIVAIAVLIGVGYGAMTYREEQLCLAGKQYYEDLAAAPADQRAALIAEGGSYVTAPDTCARDGLHYRFGYNASRDDRAPSMTETERLAVLKALFAAGLPPDERLLRRFVRSADPAAVRLLMVHRQALGEGRQPDWKKFPADAAGLSVIYVACNDPAAGPQKSSNRRLSRHREILKILVTTGPPPEKAALPRRLRRSLICLGLLPP